MREFNACKRIKTTKSFTCHKIRVTTASFVKKRESSHYSAEIRGLQTIQKTPRTLSGAYVKVPGKIYSGSPSGWSLRGTYA